MESKLPTKAGSINKPQFNTIKRGGGMNRNFVKEKAT